MAHVTLFPPNKPPMNYPDATDLQVEDGVLTFRASKKTNALSTDKYTTNIPFLAVE